MKASWKLAAATDERRGARFPIPSKLRIYWDGVDGNLTSLDVTGVNLSESGAAFLADCELPLGTPLHLELPNSRMSASGHVCSCTPVGGAWRVGMEFDAAMIKFA